jgi:hypothetical protein
VLTVNAVEPGETGRQFLGRQAGGLSPVSGSTATGFLLPAKEDDMATRRAISLAFEITALEHVVEGVRSTADHIRNDEITGAREINAALDGLSAILSMVANRLRLLRGVVTRTVDPACLITAANDVPPNRLPSDDPDVRFAEWSPEEVIKHAEQEAATAKFLASPSRRPPKRKRRKP